MLAGLLAGWCFDKKNNIPIVGIFTYIFVVNAFSLVFDYDYSWAFLAFVEMLAGHGLYKMGFGNFLGEIFSDLELKKKTNKIITASKVAKDTYKASKDDYVETSAKEVVDNNSEIYTPKTSDTTDIIKTLNPDLKQTPKEQCKGILEEKGYELMDSHPNFLVMKKNNLTALFSSKYINEILGSGSPLDYTKVNAQFCLTSETVNFRILLTQLSSGSRISRIFRNFDQH